MISLYRKLVFAATILTLVVVVVGAAPVEPHLPRVARRVELTALLEAEDVCVEAMRGLKVAHSKYEVLHDRTCRRAARGIRHLGTS